MAYRWPKGLAALRQLALPAREGPRLALPAAVANASLPGGTTISYGRRADPERTARPVDPLIGLVFGGRGLPARRARQRDRARDRRERVSESPLLGIGGRQRRQERRMRRLRERVRPLGQSN